MIVYLEVHSTNVVVVSPARRHMSEAHSLQVVKRVVTAWHVCLESPHIYFLAWHFHILPQNQVPSLAGAIPSKNLSQFWAIRDSFWEITNVLVVSPARRHMSEAHTLQIVKCVVTAWHFCLEYPHSNFLAWHFHILPQNQVPKSSWGNSKQKFISISGHSR